MKTNTSFKRLVSLLLVAAMLLVFAVAFASCKKKVDIDTNGDGTPDVNIDTNGDKKPDVNVDTDGDKKPDINIDTNGDKQPDTNLDTDGDNEPDNGGNSTIPGVGEDGIELPILPLD